MDYHYFSFDLDRGVFHFYNFRNEFSAEEVLNVLKNWKSRQNVLVIFVRYQISPSNNPRNDGQVNSYGFLSSKRKINYSNKSLFEIVANRISNPNWSFEILQIGKSFHLVDMPAISNDYTWIIPHSGAKKYLTERQCGVIGLPNCIACFDSVVDKFKIFKDHLPNIKFYLLSHKNVGPYVIRQMAVDITETKYIIFQDSDDIPTINRQVRLNSEFEDSLDGVGSHELQMDYFNKNIQAIRFPFNATAAMLNGCTHA